MSKNQPQQWKNAIFDTNLRNNSNSNTENQNIFALPKLITLSLIILLSFSLPSQAESFFAHFKLPPLHRTPPEDAASKYLKNAMVLKRLQHIPVKLTDIDGPTVYIENLRNAIKENVPLWPSSYKRVVFKGSKFSGLNRLIKKNSGTPVIIKINAPELQADETLVLSSNLFIDGNSTTVLPNDLEPAVLLTDGITHSGLKNIHFKNANHAIHLNNAEKILLSQLDLKQSTLGITITGASKYITLERLNITETNNSGLVIHGDSYHIWLHNNHISSGKSAKNEAAAVLLTDALISSNLYFALTNHQPISVQHILPVQPSPHHIIIENNIFNNNHAQGIYLDGANGVVIRRNEISSNDKEGLCLDFGSANNIITDNVISANGNRAYQSDSDLQHDLVLGFGRMSDGSAISKLPGIALDNAAQNMIIRNSITHNAGDGVKIVRSGFRNLIMFNSIIDNNSGHNSRFHFFGILLGSAGAEPEVVSNPNKSLDFYPSIENIIASNIIYGKHYSAILLDKDAAFNDVYDNVARQYVRMPLETASQSFNSIVGNSWDVEKKPGIRSWLKSLGR